jgi:hypothetical protein
MNPALLALIIQLVEVAIQEEPAIVSELQALFENGAPTPADWEALRAKVLGKSYLDYVPASALPAATSGPAPAPAAPAAGLAAPETAAVSTLTPAESTPISQTSAEAIKPTPYLADGSKNPAYIE